VTIFREGPFRFFFCSREEERIHVHVQTADGERLSLALIAAGSFVGVRAGCGVV
jgi:hypothetical protein